MTYSAIYAALISKRLSNPLTKADCYCEKHHIIPASEGGDDSEDNLVNLTAREHFIAHLLLAKIYDDSKMWNAIHWMSRMDEKHYTRITSRMYSVIRTQFSRKQSEANKGANNPMFGKHFNKPMLGKHHSVETKKKISASQKGKTPWNKGKHFNHTEEARQKLSEARRGEKNPMFGTHLHWYTDGTKNVRAKTCPKGFVPGMSKI